MYRKNVEDLEEELNGHILNCATLRASSGDGTPGTCFERVQVLLLLSRGHSWVPIDETREAGKLGIS